MKTLLRILLASVALLFAAGCVSPGTVNLPRIPTWKAPNVVRAEFTAAEVQLHASLLLPGVPVDLTDSTFSIVNHETAVAILLWTDTVYRTTGHGYTAESWDCDKFAKAYSLAVEWSASSAGVKAQPLVARIFVVQANGFAGVPGAPNAAHALAGLRTDQGYFVLEPQGSGTSAALRLVPLERYANRIFRMRIGG